MDGTQAYAEDAWLTIGQAAHYIGVHPETIRRAEVAGKIASERTPGGHRRFRVGDLHRLQQKSAERVGA